MLVFVFLIESIEHFIEIMSLSLHHIVMLYILYYWLPGVIIRNLKKKKNHTAPLKSHIYNGT